MIAEYHTVNATRLKQSILFKNEKWDVFLNYRKWYIAYKNDSGAALQYSKQLSTGKVRNIHISRAAKIITNYIFKNEQEVYAKFTKNCQSFSVPESLLSLLRLITGTSQNLEDNKDKSWDDFQTLLSAA